MTSSSKVWPVSNYVRECYSCMALHDRSIEKYATIIIAWTYWVNKKSNIHYEIMLNIDKLRKVIGIHQYKLNPDTIQDDYQSKTLLKFKYKKTG